MVTEEKDRRINTKLKIKNQDQQKKLPHERDESPDSSHTTTGPRGVIHQAAKDLERGLVDTDLHGIRGVEKVKEKPVRKK